MSQGASEQVTRSDIYALKVWLVKWPIVINLGAAAITFCILRSFH